MDYIIEAIVIAASSTGVFGAIIAALLSKAFRKAKEDADNRRNERYEGELLRSEYEELSAELLLSLARYQHGCTDEAALREAEERFTELMEKRRPFYEAAADVVVCTDGRQVDDICREILQKLTEKEAQ